MRQQATPFPRKDFGQAPANYVPGIGRGAQGFITRSDIGPAKASEPQQAPQRNSRYQDDDDNDREDYNDAKYDEWNGYQIPLFNQGEYDEEDKEADQMYSTVDDYVDGRRKTRRERQQEKELQKIQKSRPSIAQQFSDLKRDLVKVSVEQWNNIPEIGDYTVKKKKQERYTPASDSLLESSMRENELSRAINDPGIQSQLPQNLNEIGEARGTLLSLKLDKMGDNVSGQSNVDKRGYLTSLQSQIPMVNGADIGDFKKARLLLKSLIQSDPKNSFGWIAAARVEELDGKIQAARNILAQGLQHAEDNEDIWIECARLETQEKAKQILAKAVSIHPTSVKMWLAAASKETDRVMKCKVLKRGLEYIPNSEILWKEVIELSTEQEARVLLHKATEHIPHKLEIWLALAKLENYENAKAVINKARKYLPQEPSIWIHAAKLEESAGKDKYTISNILSKGIQVLAKNGVRISREEWLGEAELAEKSQNYQTCFALIRASADYGLNEEDREKIWLEDIETCVKRGSLFTARALYQNAVEKLTDKIPFIRRWLTFEEQTSSKIHPPVNHQPNISQPETPEQMMQHWYYDEALEQAVKLCPQEQDFWVQLIRRKWDIGHASKAELLLKESNQHLPDNEAILCLAGKMEAKAGNLESALHTLQRAKEVCGGVKSWTTLIKYHLYLADKNEADKLAETACSIHTQVDKLWALWALIKRILNSPDEARKIYEKALTTYTPTSQKLWINYVQMETSLGLYSRARPILDKARAKLPKNPQLWVLAVQVEIEANNRKGAVFTLNKALQECPRYGELWSLAIELEPKNTRKKKSADAVTLCVDDPYVYLSTAKIFWKEKKLEKYTKWVEKALLLNPSLGDAWAYLYLEADSPEKREVIINNCLENKPKDGRIWKYVKQNEAGWKLSNRDILLLVAKRAAADLQKIE